MKKRVSANPKPALTKAQRRKERLQLESQNRGFGKITAFWARIGVTVGA